MRAYETIQMMYPDEPDWKSVSDLDLMALVRHYRDEFSCATTALSLLRARQHPQVNGLAEWLLADGCDDRWLKEIASQILAEFSDHAVFASECVITIWHLPHKGDGHLIEIDAGLVAEGVKGGAIQNWKDISNDLASPQLNHSAIYNSFTVTPTQMANLLARAQQIYLVLLPEAFAVQMGGALYGLRVTNAGHELSVVWRGDFVSQEAVICNLYRTVEDLAKEHRS
jgi:hypothetical protein